MLTKSSKWWEADDRVVAALFLVGLAISLWMISRVQAGYDATDMLSRGWLLIQKGTWVPLGNPATGGGYVPGGMTALLVGLPLGLWMDHRAPILLILITHIVAYLLLDRLIKETLGPGARILFAVFYWINPWRLYQSAWLDNSNYAFIAGAIHLWACYRQRHKPNLWLSFLLVALVGLSVQLHLSALLLILSACFIAFHSIKEILTPNGAPAPYTLVVLIVVVTVKEFLFRWVSKVGWGPQPLGFNLDPLVQKNVTLQGSFSHNWPIWERVIALLTSGQLDVRPIIGGVWPITEWHEAFEKMHSGAVVKSVLRPA